MGSMQRNVNLQNKKSVSIGKQKVNVSRGKKSYFPQANVFKENYVERLLQEALEKKEIATGDKKN